MAFEAIGRFFYDYKLRSNAIEIVVLGGVTVKTIPFSEISDLKEISFKESLKPDFKTFRLGNRISGPILLLELKCGLFRRILITPKEPELFLKAWKSSRTL